MRRPTKLPADENLQVNEPGFVRKMMACPNAIGLFKSVARFFVFCRLSVLFLYIILFSYYNNKEMQLVEW